MICFASINSNEVFLEFEKAIQKFKVFVFFQKSFFLSGFDLRTKITDYFKTKPRSEKNWRRFTKVHFSKQNMVDFSQITEKQELSSSIIGNSL